MKIIAFVNSLLPGENELVIIDKKQLTFIKGGDDEVLTPSTVQGDKVPDLDEPPDPFADN